ncbi:MAG: alcohol dehydrogenase catalytic domain-containing protein [Thermodesulfovibrionales bacterium]
MMLSNILVKPGNIELREIDTPVPSHGELLIKIRAALTCGTDLKAFLRGHSLIPMPGVFGHEFSGVVEEVGKGVKGFKKGDEIMAVHSAPCNDCMFCKKGFYNLCENIIDTKALGAFSEYIVLPSHIVKQNVFHKPKNISFQEAAFLEPLSCVVHSIEPLNIKKGDSVLIMGAGPIGLIHLILLKRKRAKVAVSDINEERLNIAKRLGADFVIPPTPPLKNRVEGGFDFIFECTGKLEVWAESLNYLRRGGTLILFGGCEKGTKVTYDTYRLHYDELTIKGSFHYTPEDVKKAYHLICKGKLGLSRLISGRYSLNDLQSVFEKLSKGEGLKYAIIP